MTYIDPRGKPFAHLGRLAAWQQGQRAAPVTLEVDLTNRCSHGCQSCHFAHTHTRGPWASRARALTVDTGDMADAAITRRWLGEAARAGVQAVVWTGGGEPTLHPDWAALMVEAHALGLQQGIYTVGTHLTAETADVVARCAAWAVVSLDAANADTYVAEKGVAPLAWTRALEGIRHIRNASDAGGGCVVGVSFLLHARNWHRLDGMIAVGLAAGGHYVTLRPTVETDPAAPGVVTGDRAWIAGALPALAAVSARPDVEVDATRFAVYQQWTHHPYATCHGVTLNATVTPDARLWLCPNRRGDAGALLGDLRTEAFGEIWARHPGAVPVEPACRAMCRLHPINATLADVYAPRPHEAFL